MRKLLIGLAILVIFILPSSIGWHAHVELPCTVGMTVESKSYVEFWVKIRRHGYNTIVLIDEDGEKYFWRNGRRCKF